MRHNLIINGELPQFQPFHDGTLTFSQLDLRYTVQKHIILMRNDFCSIFQHSLH